MGDLRGERRKGELRRNPNLRRYVMGPFLYNVRTFLSSACVYAIEGLDYSCIQTTFVFRIVSTSQVPKI